MKIKILIILILLLIFQVNANASIAEHFNSFYYEYLEKRNVKIEDREILNIVQKISNDKFINIENFLNTSNNFNDKSYALYLIDMEYKDFLENLNFELNYVPSCSLKKKDEKKFKRAHKKYMRNIQKCYKAKIKKGFELGLQ